MGKAMAPMLSTDDLTALRKHGQVGDRRNMSSEGLKMILSHENLDNISRQKQQKKMLRLRLQGLDYHRNFTCSLARFRNEADKLDLRLREEDYDVIYNAFKVLKNIGYGQ